MSELLLPEIWRLIREHLMHPWDARDCVALQRTCRATYDVAKGILLAPLWHAPWAQCYSRNVRVTYQKRLDVLTVLTAIHASGLMDKTWLAVPVKIRFVDVPGDYSISIRWRLGLAFEGFVEYQKSDTTNKKQWVLQVIDKPHESLEVYAATLPVLLAKCPMLCFGVSEELIHMRAAATDLESLFVVREWRDKHTA